MPTIARYVLESPCGPHAFHDNILPLTTRHGAARRKLISDSTVLHISNTLQASLQVNEVIRAFAGELLKVIPHTSVTYRNRQEKYRVEIGERQPYRASYELILLQKSLGEITITRSRPLADDELIVVENIASALVYPLRNALLYEAALRVGTLDPLTGVNNRATMDTYLAQQVSAARRHSTPLSLVMCDIDLFKSINDTYGHIAGDAVLTAVAQGIVQCIRDSDVVYRYGGEEFVLILANTPSAGAQLLANRIRHAVTDTDWNAITTKLRVTVSAGIAELRVDDTPTNLLQRADQMLYLAKDLGRNQVCAAVN